MTSSAERHLPAATHQGELRLGSVTLRTYVLDDGRRIIDADDVAALFRSWETGNGPAPGEAETLAAWLKGGRS